jgi:protein O-GlcNAc transferase
MPNSVGTESERRTLLSQAQRLAKARCWDEASRLYREVLAQRPRDVEALEGLGVAALHDNRVAEGLELLSKARQQAPDNARVVGHLGIAQKRDGRLLEAIATFREAAELEPAPSHLINLARAQRDAGQLSEAIETFRRALELQRDAPEAWSMLSNVLREAGRCEEAADAARAASSRNPWLGEAHLNEGAALHRLGQLGDAIASYWVATTLGSSRGAATTNLSVALADPRCQGATAPAEVALVRRLIAAPDDASTTLRLARVQQQKQRSATAIGCLERAAGHAPSAATYLELGELLWGLGQFREAQARLLCAFDCLDTDTETYRRLAVWLRTQPGFNLGGPPWLSILNRCPPDPFSLLNLGVALQDRAIPSLATVLYQRAIALEPRTFRSYLNCGLALAAQGLFAEANAMYQRGMNLDPTRSSIVSNRLFSLHFDPRVSPEAIFAEHLEFGERFGVPRRPAHTFGGRRDPARRLRIGYVSPNLCQHPVAHFLEPVLIEHDARVVEVHCYSDVAQPDAVTARLSGLVPHFVASAGWSDTQLEQRIVSDGIDVLVDLAGHTGHNRLRLFARKPSPIQVSWLGYFDTTGLRAMDYRIADEHSVPEAAERFFVERVVRLPRSANCFLPPESPEPVEPPWSRRGHVTFGCFNNPAKVTRETVAAFGRVLREVAGSRLIFKFAGYNDPVLRPRLLAWLGEEGVSADRVDLWEHSELPHFLACFSQIDIALDPFPYSGETTALHTLWMGVPLVALEGLTLVQRLASRVLRVAGLPEWVARSEDEYVRIAVSLARAPERLAPLRASLRARLKASPLLDHAGVTRELEAAYRKMWQRWCASAEPERSCREAG